MAMSYWDTASSSLGSNYRDLLCSCCKQASLKFCNRREFALIEELSSGPRAPLRVEPVIELLASPPEFFTARRESFVLFVPDRDPPSRNKDRDENYTRQNEEYPNAHARPVIMDSKHDQRTKDRRITYPKQRANASFAYHRLHQRFRRAFYCTMLKPGVYAH